MKRRLRELAQTIMGAEKSHDMPSVNWKSRKTSGVIHSESQALGYVVIPSPRTND
jgi:hypothetical protein